MGASSSWDDDRDVSDGTDTYDQNWFIARRFLSVWADQGLHSSKDSINSMYIIAVEI